MKFSAKYLSLSNALHFLISTLPDILNNYLKPGPLPATISLYSVLQEPTVNKSSVRNDMGWDLNYYVSKIARKTTCSSQTVHLTLYKQKITCLYSKAISKLFIKHRESEALLVWPKRNTRKGIIRAREYNDFTITNLYQLCHSHSDITPCEVGEYCLHFASWNWSVYSPNSCLTITRQKSELCLSNFMYDALRLALNCLDSLDFQFKKSPFLSLVRNGSSHIQIFEGHI